MTRRLLIWVPLVLLGLPVLVLAIAVGLANLDFGRRIIEDQTASLTGGMVRIQGLSGRFPDQLRISRVEVTDAKGPYVTVTDAALDWSPTSLINRIVQVDRLQAASVHFARLPESDSKTSSSSGGTFHLPVRVDISRLQIDKAAIGAPVAGAAATLTLSGSGQVRQLTQVTAHLIATRLDGAGDYKVDGDVTADTIDATVHVAEPPKGLIAAIAKLPDLGAINIDASVNGPMEALATKLGIAAGPLRADADGSVDLTHQAADLAVHATAPAMQPAPGIGWQSVLLDAKVNGPFTKPDANGTVRLRALTAPGTRIGELAADIKGNAGQVALHATVTDLHIPGPRPDLLAAAPVVLDASATLDAPDRPATFTVSHPLLTLRGKARTAGTQTVQAHVDLPDLAPLAQAGGVDIQGHAALDLNAQKYSEALSASVTGPVAITGGMAPVPGLIGNDGHIDLAATLNGQDITLTHLAVNGKSLEVTAKGNLAGQDLNADWSIGLSDLATVAPDLSGSLTAAGHAAGALDDLAVQADIGADLASRGYQSGHVTARVDATGLPNAPKAMVTAQGTLLDSPLDLALTAEKSGDTLHADIGRLSWKTLQAGGDATLVLPATIPTGHLHIAFARLADLAPLVGKPLAGAIEATLDSDEKAAHLVLALKGASLRDTASVGQGNIDAKVTDPAGSPSVDVTISVGGVSAASTKDAAAKITAKGPLDAIALNVAASAADLAGGPARLVTAATGDAKNRTLALSRMEASWKDQTLRLLAPVKLAFTDVVSIDRLRLGFRQAELTVAGSAGSKLDLTATLRDLPASVAAIADPSLALDGTIAADARLTGTSAEPQGTVKLTADLVRLRTGPAQALPAANLVANVALLGKSAKVDARLAAGQAHVTVTGNAPLSTADPLDLRTEGRLDLAMLDPVLAAQGRRARGEITLNAAIAGKATAPKVNGTAELRNGDVVDYALGAHVSALAATIEATGDTIRLSRFSGRAGPGSLGGSGQIGLGGQMPVDLRFTADNARPLSSDLVTALIDANLTVQGEAKGDLQAGGTLRVRRADIRIPDKLPASVAVLPVRNANAPPPPPPAPAGQSQIALNLTLEAPQQVFIRGRGLDAELGGTIHIKGTASAPVPDGGLNLRRGTLSVIGTTLNFTEGQIGFNGAGLSDPTVHFVATSTTSAIVATLTVSGSAKDPKITLASVPDMPQDEILAQLLFNTSTSKLSPLQLAQIASALAQLSGATGGFDPLESLRNGLGLDRLSVGSGASGGPQVEAGRYVARGVYVGAKQGTNGGGPQATVQIDLAKGLKLETTAGSGGTTNATGSSSSTDAASVGLTYQFEY